ncbi:hypothetical protein [Falsiroseomonas sp.]|jgi:hypothetical protein|uniref:hypothetical protein n=1 Tax=Falsiroseomonas sp. TaxID=2870721 RepID=UPI003F722D36
MMRRKMIGMLVLAATPFATPAQAQQVTFIEWVPKPNGMVSSKLPHESSWADMAPPGRPARVERHSMGVLRMQLQDGTIRDFQSNHVRVAANAGVVLNPGSPDRGTAGSSGIAPR